MIEADSSSLAAAELRDLDARIRLVLPPEYQSHYEEIQPISMGSAGLRFDRRGRVAWDEIWESFCDLAMAGGPPHKGKLLEPATPAEIAANPSAYQSVVEELCRGLNMVSWLPVEPSPHPGWVRVTCSSSVMAAWLARAINMENVSAYLDGIYLDLPSGPHYRLEKEIKNVITSLAKTHHYFDGHLSPQQQASIEALFAEDPRPLLQSPRLAEPSSASLAELPTCLPPAGSAYSGWQGFACPSVGSAIWLMRALVAFNTLSRREDRTLFLPINPSLDPGAARLCGTLTQVHRLAVLAGQLPSRSS